MSDRVKTDHFTCYAWLDGAPQSVTIEHEGNRIWIPSLFSLRILVAALQDYIEKIEASGGVYG